MLIFKWGDGLALLLPKELVDEIAIKDGDELNVVAASNSTVEVETKGAQRQRALDRLRERNWPLPEDYKFHPDEANER
ncbi:MAG: AbrB/MazE/SpoVT family DNA-binding domain-containing protein [Bradyrhizobium sp.]